ncbi:uncharacterized protein LOC118197959 [Stegodyphus dumicola]|uniref:uncharacterized protein LOC118197959 n=1 Tax=Stegodyphus dumicola TaxID=202533 RepID=UPI0015AA5D00|nr:uncharacterized protein LOC118197959 [Stegodyphus dumicola]
MQEKKNYYCIAVGSTNVCMSFLEPMTPGPSHSSQTTDIMEIDPYTEQENANSLQSTNTFLNSFSDTVVNSHGDTFNSSCISTTEKSVSSENASIISKFRSEMDRLANLMENNPDTGILNLTEKFFA